MFVVLPLISFILLFLIFNKTEPWRSSILSAAVCWGFLVTAITEILSIFKLITFTYLLLGWLMVSIILIFLYIRSIRKDKENISNPAPNTEKPIYLLILLFGIVLVAGTVGLIAAIAPTNNWDSMAYHLPRVVHWMQNRSVAHYPTNYLAQLYQSPWAEFTIMNFQILSGGDRLANLVQWFSMVGSAIGVSSIAKELGANLLGQIFSSVVAVTIPMGILQASSTKNDYAVCFWLVCLAYFILKSLKSKITIFDCLKVAASLGLAYFTKGTAYIYALPFLLWFTTGAIAQWRWKFWKPLLWLACIAILINLGHYIRNFDLFGTPIYNPPEYKITSINFLLFISNVIRNMALHTAIPFDIVNNDSIEKLIINIHKILGVNINDPRTTSPGVEFGISGLSTFENTAGNPFHFYLILISIIIFSFDRRLKKQPYLIQYLMAVIAAFLIFCLLIKWQPWQSRLHISLFVLFAPFVAVVFSGKFNQRVSIYIALFLLQISLFWVCYNESRPLIGENNIFITSRTEQYFANKRYLKDDYVEAVKFVKDRSCAEVGLYMPPDRWEYPLWVLFKKDSDRTVRIEHLNISNISAIKSERYPYKDYKPCAIISVGYPGDREIVTKNGSYIKKWSGTNFREEVNVFFDKNYPK